MPDSFVADPAESKKADTFQADPTPSWGQRAVAALKYPIEQALGPFGKFDVAMGLKTPQEAKETAESGATSILETALLSPAGAIAGAAGKVLPILRGPFAQAVTRPAVMTAEAAGLKALQGQSPLEAWPTALWGLAGEAGGRLYTTARQLIPGAVQKAETTRIGKQVGEVLPEVKAESKERLFELTREGSGRKVRGEILGTLRENLEATLAGEGKQQLTIPALGDEPRTISQAMKDLKALGDKAWPASGTVNLSLTDRQAVGEARRAYGAAKQGIIAALNQANPGLGDRFQETYARTAAQAAYLELMDKAMDNRSGLVSPGKVMALVNKAPERWAMRFGPYWDQIRPILLRGQDVPALADVPTPIAGGTGTTIARLARSALGTPYPAVYPYRAPFAVDPTTQAALDVLMQRPEVQALAIGAGQYLWPSHRTRSRTEELLEGGL